jgi:hypothetical protein
LARVVGLAAASATAAPALLLAIIVLIRTDLHEVDVGRRVLRAADRVVVGRARVIRDDVAWLELESFEHECVARRDVLDGARPFVQRQDVFVAAVDRIHEIQLGDAIVVLGARFRVDLVD